MNKLTAAAHGFGLLGKVHPVNETVRAKFRGKSRQAKEISDEPKTITECVTYYPVWVLFCPNSFPAVRANQPDKFFEPGSKNRNADHMFSFCLRFVS